MRGWRVLRENRWEKKDDATDDKKADRDSILSRQPGSSLFFFFLQRLGQTVLSAPRKSNTKRNLGVIELRVYEIKTGGRRIFLWDVLYTTTNLYTCMCTTKGVFNLRKYK